VKTYQRYTVVRILRGFALMLFVLATLFGSLALLEELSEIGEGDYGWIDALVYVALTTPNRTLDIVPLVGLLGCILSLGAMANANELVALRALGVSPRRIAYATLIAASVLVGGALLVAEFVAPGLQKSAVTRRSFLIHDPEAIALEQGFWFREGSSFIQVGRVLRGRRLGDVTIYDRDAEGRLVARTHASEAQVLESGRWVLSDVERDVIGQAEVTATTVETLEWESTLGPSLLELTVLSQESLSLSDLFLYVESMRARGQPYDRYALRLWRYLALAPATCAMVLLAIPFVFALRRSSSGLRTTLGCLVGALAYALDRIGSNVGLLGGLDPMWTALFPGLLILAIALVLLRRLG